MTECASEFIPQRRSARAGRRPPPSQALAARRSARRHPPPRWRSANRPRADGRAGALPDADRHRGSRIRDSPGPAINSPREGTRPASVTMNPPSVSMSSALSSALRSMPNASVTSSRLARASAMKVVVCRRDDHPGRCVVMLVLDVADDHLDEILDRDEAVGAAILVDDERHMGARRLHPHQKVDCRHRAGHEQDRPQDLGRGEAHRQVDPAKARRDGSAFLGRPPPAGSAGVGPHGEEVQKIADVDHALADRRGSRRRQAAGNDRRSERGSGGPRGSCRRTPPRCPRGEP